MELEKSIQMSQEYLQKQHFDAVLVVSGHETRSTFLVDKIDVSKIPVRIAIAYTEQTNCNVRNYNDDKFSRLGFDIYMVSVTDTSSVSRLLDMVCKKSKKEDINILIDYSCMSKAWYNSIISYFHVYEDELQNVKLWFSYSPSDYVKPSDLLPRSPQSSIPKISGKKPLAMIFGLGRDKDALEIYSAVKAELSYAFLASPALDERYVKEVWDNNEKFIKRIDPDKLITYPLSDLETMNKSLTQLCLNLRMSYEVVLVPLGPKPFTLMCSVLTARYPDIKFWNVPTASGLKVADRKPFGELLLLTLEFTNVEVDY